jgi:hypothetical protein
MKGIPKKTKLKQGEIQEQTRGDLMALVWREERHSHVDQYTQSGNTIKPHTVEEYNRHISYADKIEKTDNNHSINWMRNCSFSSVR